jgi:hypothetical protein
MTNAWPHIARALTAHTFELQFSLLITGRKQWSGSDHTRRLVLHTTQQRVRRAPVCLFGGPGSAVP